jgi:parallel beta-helix repeat protein
VGTAAAAAEPPGGPRFEVTDFGAWRDGLHDDLPAVGSAVDAAAGAGGGTVHFPPGTYLWDGMLVVTADRVTLEGAPGAVIQAARSEQRLILARDVEAFRLQGLALAGAEGGTVGIAVQLRGCTGCEIVGCRFDGIGTSAIDVTEGSERCRVAGNTIRESPGHAIMISGWTSPTDPARGSTQVEVHDNVIHRPGNTGVSVEVGNRQVSVRGNRITGANRNRERHSAGVAVFNGTEEFEIAGNLIAGTLPFPEVINTGNAILIGQGESRTPPRRGRIAGNALLWNGHLGGPGPADCARDDCQGSGIHVSFPDHDPVDLDLRIEGNLILESGRSGLFLADSSGVTARGNVILGSHGQGIRLRPSAPGNRLLANLVERSANHGIRVGSAGNLVAGNLSRGNGLSGIYLGPEAHDNRVEGNVLEENDRAGFGHAGIFLDAEAAQGASRNLLRRNRFRAARGPDATPGRAIRIHGPECRDNRIADGPPGEGGVVDAGTGTLRGGAAVPPGLPPLEPIEPILCSPLRAAARLETGSCAAALLRGGGTVEEIGGCEPGAGPRAFHLRCDDAATAAFGGPGNIALDGAFACSRGASFTLLCESGRWREVDRWTPAAGAAGSRPDDAD